MQRFYQSILIIFSFSGIQAQVDSLNYKDIKEVVLHGLDEKEKEKRKTSQSVEFISKDEISRHLSGSLMQTLDRVAGVDYIGIGSGQSKPMIRGLAFNRVVVSEEGVRHEAQQWGADHGLEIDQFSVSKVKLIKGAASLALGSEAIGGVVFLEREKMPHQEMKKTGVNFLAKSVNELWGASVFFQQKKNHFYYAIRSTYLDYGDYKVPTEEVSSYSYRAKLHQKRMRNTAGEERNFHFSFGWEYDKVSSIFYWSYLHHKSGFFANAHGLEPRNVDTERYDFSSRDVDFPNQEVGHFKLINKTYLKYGKHLLSFISGFQKNHRQELGYYINHGYMPNVFPADLKMNQNQERIFDKSTYTLTIKDDFSHQNHQLSMGGDFNFQDNQIGGWGFIIPSFQQWSFGVFSHYKYKINPRLNFNLGARYDRGKIKTKAYQDWFLSPVSGGFSYMERARDLNKNFDDLSWALGLNYNFNHWNLRLNLGKSFRMPQPKELAANGVNYHYFSYERGNANLSSETSYQWDGAVEFNKGKFSAEFSPFFQYFPNYIYLNPTSDFDFLYGAGNQVFNYTQSKVQRYGAELKLNYEIFSFLQAELLADYLYAKQLSGAKKGYGLPFSPPASVLVNLTYRPKISSFFKENYIGMDYKFSAKQSRVVPPEEMTMDSSVFNFFVETQFLIDKNTRFKLNFQIQNLLNKKYFNHTNFYRLIGVPEAGRNFVFSASVEF